MALPSVEGQYAQLEHHAGELFPRGGLANAVLWVGVLGPVAMRRFERKLIGVIHDR